jgi:dihydrofolate reductase
MGRRIIGGFFQSVDGVVQAPGGPEEDPTGGFRFGGWLAPLFDEGLGNQISALLSEPYDLLLGRRTYDIFAAHWPHISLEDPIAAAFNRIAKYVLSRSELTSDWQNSHRLADMEALAALKREDGPSLVIQGSTTLYPQLLAHGLLDRIVTMTAPLILGGGKRAFDGTSASRTLKMVEQRVTSSGIVMTTYDVAGQVKTGSFGTPEPPSEAELARRERMMREDAQGAGGTRHPRE